MKLTNIDLNLNNKVLSFHYREDSIGDRGVIIGIFNNNDYDIEHWPHARALNNYYHDKSINQNGLIVDGGANIGASVLYFLTKYQNTFVYAIEPDPKNFLILEVNTDEFENKFNFEGALASSNDDLFLIDPHLSDWGFRTSEQEIIGQNSKKVKCIQPNTILSDEKYSKLFPFIFKIDIEGGESNLFSKNTEWIDQFPLIIIELHDWLLPFQGNSKSLLNAISRLDFDMVIKGENFFFFNRKILNQYFK